MDINGKVVVITGGSKGLGKGLAEAFAKEGGKVVIAARGEEELKRTASEIGVLPVVADVTKEDDLKNLAEKAVEHYGRIDIWINDAGVWMPHAPIEETDWKRVHELMEVNMFGVAYGCKAALIQMRKQGTGAIITILSTAALEGRAGSSGYSASKYAAVGLTKSLRKEVEGTDIKALAVYPGGMQTTFFDEKKPDNIENYMLYDDVAAKILENVKRDAPEEDLIIKRPKS